MPAVINSDLQSVMNRQLIRSKCIPALLYGLDPCPLNKADINSLDFVINLSFFMKLFCTGDINIVHECQLMLTKFTILDEIWMRNGMQLFAEKNCNILSHSLGLP